MPGQARTAPGGSQASGGLPPSPHQLKTMTASILSCHTDTLGPRSGGHVLRQTSHSATEKSTLQDAGQLAGVHRMQLRHKPGPYVLPGRTRKVKTGTGRMKGPYSGSCAQRSRPARARKVQEPGCSAAPGHFHFPPVSGPHLHWPQPPHLPALFRTVRSAWASGRLRGLGWARLD